MSTSSRVVSSHATAFVEARRFVRDSVGPPVPRRIVDDAILLTSELVTNAVRHAGHHEQDEIEVTVSVDARVLRITVRDRGPGFDPEVVVPRSDEGGWGLDLLRRLSSRWSVDRGSAGTDVWFEIDLPDGSGSEGEPRSHNDGDLRTSG